MARPPAASPPSAAPARAASSAATSSGRSPAPKPAAAQASDRQAAARPPSGARSTGEHSPVRARGPARQNSSDRQTGKPAPRTVTSRGPRISLKMKFMLVMASVTAVAMILLGATMNRTANNYLMGQKTQDGIELGRMATVIAQVVNDRIRLTKVIEGPQIGNLQKEIERDLKLYFTEMHKWGGNDEYSDIKAIHYSCTVEQLSGAGYGPEDKGGSKADELQTLFIPKLNQTIPMPEGIKVYEGYTNTDQGSVHILRFKIDLPGNGANPPNGFGKVPTGNGFENAHVRVDLAMSSIEKVRSNLALTAILAVIIAIAVVLGIAQWMASSITRPLEILLRDMQTVSKGRLDHRTTATSNDELGILATEFNKMTGSLEVAQVAVVEQEKASYELSLAREVQQQLLPSQPPLITGFQCHSFYQGAKAVSGDYFDFIPLGNGLWGFIIADVSGKGIPGSMVMAVTRTVVRLVAPNRQAKAEETLKDTNRLIARQIKRGMFVTSFYAVLDERTGQLTYSSAGHNPMVVYRAKTRSYELVTTKGIALGFNEGPVFDRTIQQGQAQLEHGDVLVLYTDGFTEAMNGKNEEFGDEPFYNLIAANGHLEPPALVEAVVGGIAKHRGDAEQSDDLTILTVRRA